MRSRLLIALAVAAAAWRSRLAEGPRLHNAARPSTPGAALSTTAAGRSSVTLVVPKGLGGGPFATPRKVVVPTGWTARVWARVPDARMEAWTPEGDLLVSEPSNGLIVELKPGAQQTGGTSVLLTGLNTPQGMAFAKVSGQLGPLRRRGQPDRPVPLGRQGHQRRPHRDRR